MSPEKEPGIEMKNKSRAVLWVEDKLVLIKRQKEIGSIYYVFPGGSVEVGENAEEACVRELKEELGIDVYVKRLMLDIIDYNNSIKESFYECEFILGTIGSGLDKKFIEGTEESNGYSISLLDKSELKDIKLLPSTVKDKLLLL